MIIKIILLISVSLLLGCNTSKKTERRPEELIKLMTPLKAEWKYISESTKLIDVLEQIFNAYSIKHDIYIEPGLEAKVKFKGEVKSYFLEILAAHPNLLINFLNNKVSIKTKSSLIYSEFFKNLFRKYSGASDFIIHRYDNGTECIKICCVYSKYVFNEKALYIITKMEENLQGYLPVSLEILIYNQKFIISERQPTNYYPIFPIQSIKKERIAIYKITDVNIIEEIERHINLTNNHNTVLIKEFKIVNEFFK